jgi:hypothetical protein
LFPDERCNVNIYRDYPDITMYLVGNVEFTTDLKNCIAGYYRCVPAFWDATEQLTGILTGYDQLVLISFRYCPGSGASAKKG